MKNKSRTVQQIFNLMIELDYYSIYTDYMCLSLGNALIDNVITLEEHNKASKAISEYLNYLNGLLDNPPKFEALASYLNALDGDHYNYYSSKGTDTFQINKKIYLDWESRPMFRDKLTEKR